MSTDLLPFSAFAPESCAVPTAAAPDGHTLTVQLRMAKMLAADEPMAGTIALRASRTASPDCLHAGVVAADASPATITF
jgi:hypothetical protein